jgi:hypothetical protein
LRAQETNAFHFERGEGRRGGLSSQRTQNNQLPPTLPSCVVVSEPKTVLEFCFVNACI